MDEKDCYLSISSLLKLSEIVTVTVIGYVTSLHSHLHVRAMILNQGTFGNA